MSQNIPTELTEVLAQATQQVRAPTDRRKASGTVKLPRRRRRDDALATAQHPPLSWN